MLKEYANLGDVYNYLYDDLMKEYKYQQETLGEGFSVVSEKRANRIIIRFSLMVLEDIANLIEHKRPQFDLIKMSTDIWYDHPFQQYRSKVALYYNVNDDYKYMLRSSNTADNIDYLQYIDKLQEYLASKFNEIINLERIRKEFYNTIVINENE